MHKPLFILVFLITVILFKPDAFGFPRAVVVKQLHHSVRVDSSRIQIREFHSAAISKYLHDPAFNYHTSSTEQESWWDRFWEWLWHLIERLFGHRTATGSSSSPMLQYLALALIVGLLIYAIIKAAGIDNIFKKEPKQTGIAYTESLEDIHQINFDEAIENAVSVKNYRLAVRFLYLRCLKQMSDAKLINWRTEKTNYAYLNELESAEQRRRFTIITRQFEFAWYGDFPIDGQTYQNINTYFQEFKEGVA